MGKDLISAHFKFSGEVLDTCSIIIFFRSSTGTRHKNSVKDSTEAPRMNLSACLCKDFFILRSIQNCCSQFQLLKIVRKQVTAIHFACLEPIDNNVEQKTQKPKGDHWSYSRISLFVQSASVSEKKIYSQSG